MKRCPKCGKSFPDEANFCPTDAGRLVTMEDARPKSASSMPISGLVGGRFELGPVIGGTHTGPVHRATDSTDGKAVAVKLVASAVLAVPQVAQRIERELKQLERVQHKGVVRVIASGKHGDKVFFASDLLDGARSLAELIAASGPVDAQRASDLVLAIGEALIEAAKVGVVHRDLSPKNVMVTKDALQLINFCVPTPGEKAGGVVEFVAPETFEGKPVDQRSNIYSLAAVYYFLLTGRAPHVGDPATVMAAHLAGTVEPPSKHAAAPADVDALVVKALERNAAKRFLTLRQFLDAVDAVSRGPEGGVGSTAPFGRAGKTRELSQTLMGFGGTGAAFSQAALDARTKQIDVPIPAAAMRDAAALDDAVRAADPALSPVAPPDQAHGAPPQSAAVAPQVAYVAPAPAPEMAAAPVVAAAAVPATPPGGDSPWAPPRDAVAPAVSAAAPVASVAAPAVSAPQPAVSAPKIAAAPAGKKRPEEQQKKKDSKGKFRETMWFKKGDLDAQAAEEAAATGDAAAAGKADLMPMEERYTDDGSITSTDGDRYSLRTGATSTMQAVRDDSGPDAGSSVSERELVGEMKGGRNKVIIVIAVMALVVIAIIAAFVV